jgi:hypothetical protein
MREKIQVDVRIFETMCFQRWQISAFGRVLRRPNQRNVKNIKFAGFPANVSPKVGNQPVNSFNSGPIRKTLILFNRCR